MEDGALRISEREDGAVRRIEINGEMVIYGAGVLKGRLLGALEAAAEVEIDLSQVSEIDTAGLQVLVLLKRESLRLGKALRLVTHSAPVIDLLGLYNMAAYFGDPLLSAKS